MKHRRLSSVTTASGSPVIPHRCRLFTVSFLDPLVFVTFLILVVICNFSVKNQFKNVLKGRVEGQQFLVVDKEGITYLSDRKKIGIPYSFLNFIY